MIFRMLLVAWSVIGTFIRGWDKTKSRSDGRTKHRWPDRGEQDNPKSSIATPDRGILFCRVKLDSKGATRQRVRQCDRGGMVLRSWAELM